MLLRVIAKNIGDVFLRHSVFEYVLNSKVVRCAQSAQSWVSVCDGSRAAGGSEFHPGRTPCPFPVMFHEYLLLACVTEQLMLILVIALGGLLCLTLVIIVVLSAFVHFLRTRASTSGQWCKVSQLNWIFENSCWIVIYVPPLSPYSAFPLYCPIFFLHSFIHLFIYLFIHFFIYLLIYLFIYLFI